MYLLFIDVINVGIFVSFIEKIFLLIFSIIIIIMLGATVAITQEWENSVTPNDLWTSAKILLLGRIGCQKRKESKTLLVNLHHFAILCM